MLGNYLITALRNLKRNRLYAAITILGLAAAFCAAILIAQFVRGEFSYDRWLPGYPQVYKITNELDQPGQPPVTSDLNPAILGRQLQAVMPDAVIGRVYENFPPIKHLSGDEAVSDTGFAWVDADLFKVFPLPVLAGDLGLALQQPNTVAITRAVARRYFHRDAPLGDTLMVDAFEASHPRAPMTRTWRPLRVTAVLKDLPSNTNLASEIFAAGQSAQSDLAKLDGSGANLTGTVPMYVRVPVGRSAADLQRAVDAAGKLESDIRPAPAPAAG